MNYESLYKPIQKRVSSVIRGGEEAKQYNSHYDDSTKNISSFGHSYPNRFNLNNHYKVSSSFINQQQINITGSGSGASGGKIGPNLSGYSYRF